MDHVSRTTKYWLPWLVGMPAETTIASKINLIKKDQLNFLFNLSIFRISLLFNNGQCLKQFPKLKLCFAHGGGSFPFTVGRIQHGISTMNIKIQIL